MSQSRNCRPCGADQGTDAARLRVVLHTSDRQWPGAGPCPKGSIICVASVKKLSLGMTKAENRAAAKAYHQERMQKHREEAHVMAVAADRARVVWHRVRGEKGH